MFRYKLRTLLIVLAVAPPLPALGWWLFRNPGYVTEFAALLVVFGEIVAATFLLFWLSAKTADR